MNRKSLIAVFFVLLLGVFFVPKAKASIADGAVNFQVKNAPFELPGQVLEPGKYEIEFQNMEHTLVLVRDRSTNEPVGFFMVEPTYRFSRSDKAAVHFSEISRKAPERLTSFYIPGYNDRYSFLYPQSNQANMKLASNTPLAMPASGR